MRDLLGALAAVTMVVLFAAPAHGGSLDFGPPGQPGISDFAPVTLNGVSQITSLAIDPFSVVDTTGSGAGWNVTLTVSNLVNGASIIPASSITMAKPTVTPANGASMTGVAGHPSTGNLSTGEKIVTADAGDGDGTYLVSPSILTLTIPPDALVGTYAGAATISVVSGP